MATERIGSSLDEKEALTSRLAQLQSFAAETSQRLSELRREIVPLQQRLNELRAFEAGELRTQLTTHKQIEYIEDQLREMDYNLRREKLIAQAVSYLAPQVEVFGEFTHPIPQALRSVIETIVTDDDFRAFLPELIEGSIEDYLKQPKLPRVAVMTESASLRLMLSRNHLVIIYHPDQDSGHTELMEQVLQNEPVNTGYHINPHTLLLLVDPQTNKKTQAVMPLVVIEANPSTQNSVSRSLSWARHTDFHPIFDRVLDILTHGDIVLPKVLGNHRIKR
ncbi:hypothetical protein HY408_02325 [Candidatus Gottesmanbacteria bacterium]|nr:hypothetical protein [Candidatus Gottesmanbacteria bacterium]